MILPPPSLEVVLNLFIFLKERNEKRNRTSDPPSSPIGPSIWIAIGAIANLP